MSHDIDPPDEWWRDNVFNEPNPGESTYQPVPQPGSTDSDSLDEPPTSPIDVVALSTQAENDDTTDSSEWPEAIDDSGDDSEPITITPSPVVHTWQFIGEVVLYSFLAILTVVCIAGLDFVAIRNWKAPIFGVIVATIALLAFATWLYAHYLRHADRRWDESNLYELDEEILYDRIPHISMFLNSIVVQAGIWIISFLLISVALHALHAQWYWHVGIQIIVTAVNVYFVTRTYVNWTGTRYIVTRVSIIIIRPDLFWLHLRNNPRKEILAHTLVDHGRRQSTLSEKFAYNTRGTAMLTTQEEGAGRIITLRYISGITHFVNATSTSRKSGRN